MVSSDILILSVYALYSIFKEERLEFRYNTVSTSVNLGEISLTKFLLYTWNANTVVPHYNDHLYNGNFYFRRNFIGNGSFLIKIYYIITEYALSDTDDDSSDEMHFFYTFLFIKTTEKSSDILFADKQF